MPRDATPPQPFFICLLFVLFEAILWRNKQSHCAHWNPTNPVCVCLLGVTFAQRSQDILASEIDARFQRDLCVFAFLQNTLRAAVCPASVHPRDRATSKTLHGRLSRPKDGTVFRRIYILCNAA